MSSTRTKPLFAGMFRSLIFLTILGLCHGIFESFRNDGFAENLLQNLTNFDIDAVGHSIIQLKDGSVIISGVLRYPAGVQTYESFEDERDILEYDNFTDTSRFAGMVMRVFGNGTRAWAKRTALCTHDATFTAVYDGEFVYVAGGTTGVPLGLGTSDCCKDAAGMVLIRYNINGSQEVMKVHGDPGERYTSISLTPAESDSLFLTSCTPAHNGPYLQEEDKAPLENGLTISRVRKRDMVLVQQQIISDATTVKGELLSDRFWDIAVSRDGRSIFVAAYREVLRFGTTFIPTLFSIRGDNLTTVHTRSLENELQVDIRLATSSVSDGAFVSYVDRRANKEQLVVRHMGKNLSDVPWGSGTESMFRHRILLETEFLKEIRSTVKDIAVDGGSTVRVLVHSAEVVNRSLVEPSASPPPSFEFHRKLTNGRPALVVISPLQQISHIIQAQSVQQWEPYQMVIGDEEHIIVGADRGLIFEGVAKVLLTGVKRRTLASPKPSPSASPKARPPRSPLPSPTGGRVVDCLGESTKLSGKRIDDIVRNDDTLRLQIHPLRWGRRVEVLCHSWNNGTEDKLCATGNHVVRYWGKVMYMKDFCERVECEQRVEGVLNFKGGCDDEVAAHEVLSVTMHAGGRSAEEAVTMECGLMGKMKWLWWLTTL